MGQDINIHMYHKAYKTIRNWKLANGEFKEVTNCGNTPLPVTGSLYFKIYKHTKWIPGHGTL